MSAKLIVGDPQSPMAVYPASAIKSCQCILSSALSGEELVIDQLLPVIYSAAYIRVRFVPADSAGLITADGYVFMVYPGDMRPDKIAYGTPVYYYDGNTLVGKFYFQQAVRTAKSYFDLTAVSGVGILDGQTHYGGIYTGQTFQAVAGEIINGVFSFRCAADVAAVPIYNWLPIASRRANLHQLLFATGVILLKDSNGEVYFRYPDTDTLKNIPDSRIFYGGNVDYMVSASRVDVTEHTYISLESDEVVTLFDNTQSGETAVDVFVSFPDGPIHDLAVTGTITISESGVNYAVISGLGTLTGKRYTHVTRVLSKSVENHSGEQKTATVSNATLVNAVNSQNVLDRVLSYYSSARRIRSDIVLTDEKPGDQVAFNNPYNEPESAYLANMEINSSSFLRAACEMITGYIPSGGGNNYTQSVVLTGEGEWESPITGKIKVAIIGGGHGGQGGYCGETAETIMCDVIKGEEKITFYSYYPGSERTEIYSQKWDFGDVLTFGGRYPGKGGQPGNLGSGGKILIVTLDVTKGQKFSYKSGAGGKGGKGQYSTEDNQITFFGPEDGSAGTETVFGLYSSDNGVELNYGFLDVLTGINYGLPGNAGLSGNDGYKGGAVGQKGFGPYPGNPGSGIEIGAPPWYEEDEFSFGGGGTGGSSYGSQSTQGGGLVEGDSMESGSGAQGSTPQKPITPLLIGTGGAGGNGGGGGGCAGDMSRSIAGNIVGITIFRKGGFGGFGSDGGDGADGGIIIYM